MPLNPCLSPHELFDAALDLDPGGRDSWLALQCAHDSVLNARVARLLSWHDRAGDFLERPILVDLVDFSAALGSATATRTAVQPAETILNAASHGVSPTAGMIGRTIGRYTVRRLIAVGGMGAVYEAEQDRPRRSVALKLVHSGLASRSALRRFEFESQLLAHLRHPGIAQVYDAGTHDDGHGEVPYFAMEYIPSAKRLTEFARDRKLGSRQKLELFAQVCDAVHHGHQKGIIHRDLKPGNILVDAAGQPKIIDFGVARCTDSDVAATMMQTDVGQLIGTLQYMSPEQCLADPHDIDTRSDVYALGVVLYELLCGRMPYNLSGIPTHQATWVIREHPPARLSTIDRTLRGDLETIVSKSLEKDRNRRYQSADELARDVLRYLRGEVITARPPSVGYQLRILARRHKAAFTFVSTLFLVLLGFGIWMSVLYARAGLNLARALTAEQVSAKEASNARQEAEKALQVQKFLQQTLAAVDPSTGKGNAEGRGPDVTLREVLDLSASRIGTEFQDRPEIRGVLLSTIGSAYYSLADFNAAEKYLRAALPLLRDAHDGDHPDVDNCLDMLAESLYLLKKPESLTVQEESLEMRKRLYKDKYPLIADAMHDLALFLTVWGGPERREEAEELARQAMDIYREHEGPEHPRWGYRLWAYGAVQRNLGRYEEAERLIGEGAALNRKLLGSKHLDTLISIDSHAWVLERLGRFEEAIAARREEVEIVPLLYSDMHPLMADVYMSLAVLLGRHGDAEEARAARAEFLAVRKRVADRPEAIPLHLAQYAWNLMWSEMQELQDPATALLYAEKAVKFCEEGQEDLPRFMHVLAWAHYRLGNASEALLTERQALALMPPSSLPSRLPAPVERIVRIDVENSLAIYLHANGDFIEAEAMCRETLADRRAIFGDIHRDLIQPLQLLGRILSDQDRLDEAEPVLRECLGIQEKALPADTARLQETRDLLNEVLARKDQSAQPPP